MVASGRQPAYALPSPGGTWRALVSMASTGRLWGSLGITLRRTVLGLACLIGIAWGRSAPSAASSTPSPDRGCRCSWRCRPSSVVIGMLALGPTAGVVLLVVVLVSAPLITASTRDAIGQVDPVLLEMAHAFGRGPAWRGRHTIPSNRSGFPIEGDAPMRASRRDVLAWSAAVAALGLAGCSSREGGAASSSSTSSGPIDDLRVYVPTTLAFMAPMAAFGDELKSEGAVEEVTIRNWAGVDVLTSLLLDHEADVAAVPSYVGADPCTKGDDLRLAAITVWGMLYVLGPKEDEGADDMGLLTGRRIGVPPPNDMPDLVFRYLLAQKGIDAAGIDIVPYPDAQELLNAFVSGQLDWAVCPSAPPLSPSPSPPRPAARWGASSTCRRSGPRSPARTPASRWRASPCRPPSPATRACSAASWATWNRP